MCDQCPYTTSRTDHLKLHQAKHSREKFKCNQCFHETLSEAALINHIMNDHHEKRKINVPKTLKQCQWCSYSSYRRLNVLRHEKSCPKKKRVEMGVIPNEDLMGLYARTSSCTTG